MPKIYFNDLGLRNSVMANFLAAEGRADIGALLENFVFCELKKKYKVNERLFYWRTLAKAEVDFIIKDESGKIVPIEVKAQKMSSSRISRSLRNFITAYNPEQAVVVNLDYAAEEKINNTVLYFIPAFAL